MHLAPDCESCECDVLQGRERKGRKKVQGKVSRVQENVVRDGGFTGGIYSKFTFELLCRINVTRSWLSMSLSILSAFSEERIHWSTEIPITRGPHSINSGFFLQVCPQHLTWDECFLTWLEQM